MTEPRAGTGTASRRENPPQAVRDYGQLVRQLEASRASGLRRSVIGESAGHPLLRFDLTGDRPAPARVLLLGGTHGDEPAGPATLLKLLRSDLSPWRGRVDLVILPCVNPWGYIHDRRENVNGVDINRSFEDDGAPEAVLLKELFDGEHFDGFFEFHEDWEFEGYYLFECRGEEDPSLGAAIVDRVRPLGPIYNRPEVDEVPVHDGVATATESVLRQMGDEIGLKALPLWLFRSGRAAWTITSETPSRAWDLERRVAAHQVVIDVCLARLMDGR